MKSAIYRTCGVAASVIVTYTLDAGGIVADWWAQMPWALVAAQYVSAKLYEMDEME